MGREILSCMGVAAVLVMALAVMGLHMVHNGNDQATILVFAIVGIVAVLLIGITCMYYVATYDPYRRR